MKSSEQLKGWAIDRAIEMHKIGGNAVDAEAVKKTAQSFMDFCFNAEELEALDAPPVEEAAQ